MKTIYLLTLILVFGNCITTTSYYPEGIENKQNTEIESNKSGKPKVNISMNDTVATFFGKRFSTSENIDKLFQHIPNSPILLEVKTNLDNSRYLMGFFLVIPGFMTEQERSVNVRYGSEEKFVEKEFKVAKRVYLPIPCISLISYIISNIVGINKFYTSASADYTKQEKNFLLSLREEIAKIAPLADPDSDTPQTTDLPTTFNDIVVLKNGDILEGVHTKVTPSTLEVTESNGKKTIYKKSQVLSVKKK